MEDPCAISPPLPAQPRSGRRRARRGKILTVALAALALTLVEGGSPTPPAAAASPKTYVGLFGDNAVGVLDPGAHRVVRTIPIPTGPEGLIMAPDGLRVYVSSQGASAVSVISTRTDRVVSTIDVGQSPHGLALTGGGRTLLAAVFGADQVVMIDTIRNLIVARFPVEKPHNIAIAPDGRTAYVASQQPGATALVVLDLAGRREVGRVPLAKTPRAAAFSPDGSALYFTLAGSDAVQVLDPLRNQVVAQIPVGTSPHHVLFTPNGKYALVVVQGPGELAVINPTSRQVVGTVAVGKFPHWIALTSDGSTAYVTNEGGNSVSVVDVDRQIVLATIPLGNAPRKIVTQPATVSGSYRGSGMTWATAATLAATPAPGQAGTGPGRAIRIADFAFGPATLTVAAGQNVTWTNTDSIPHTTTSVDRLWNSGPLEPGASFSVTFDEPGIYTYGCSIHPFMRAKVTVEN